MRRPSRPLQRLAAAALAALAALAACAPGTEIPECPGVEQGTFRLLGTTRTAAACQGDTAPADGTVACLEATPSQLVDCQTARPVPACCFDRLFPPSIPVSGIPLAAAVAYGSQGSSAALCLLQPGASPYLGTRVEVAGGQEISVALDTAGAVLASCAATCAVTVRHQVTGLVARDPVSGAVTGFTGQYVETASATPSATCPPCAAPCSATWTLAPAP